MQEHINLHNQDSMVKVKEGHIIIEEKRVHKYDHKATIY